VARGRGAKETGPQERPALRQPRDNVGGALLEQLAKGNDIRDSSISSWDELRAARERWYGWRDYVRELLRAVFTTPELAEEFGASTMGAIAFGGPPDLGEDIEAFRTGIGRHVQRLDSIINRLPLFDAPDAPEGQPRQSAAMSEAQRRVFIVHGRNRAPVDAVARLLQEQGLEAVILDEQPNQGRTIIEKFEGHADVAFAVVVLSPDDHGGLAGEPSAPRARQNVILELGFFIGKLGRHRVAALLDGSIEVPSDIDGVLYIPLDVGREWRFTLAKELRTAGLDVDLNRV
jgi:predicted nucleotide-binding protein